MKVPLSKMLPKFKTLSLYSRTAYASNFHSLPNYASNHPQTPYALSEIHLEMSVIWADYAFCFGPAPLLRKQQDGFGIFL